MQHELGNLHGEPRDDEQAGRAQQPHAAGRRGGEKRLRGQARATGRRGDDQAGRARRQRPHPQVAEEGVPHDRHDGVAVAGVELLQHEVAGRRDARRDQAAGGGDRQARAPDRAAAVVGARDRERQQRRGRARRRRSPAGLRACAPTGRARAARARARSSRPTAAAGRRSAAARSASGIRFRRSARSAAPEPGDPQRRPRRPDPRTARGACARRRCGSSPGTSGSSEMPQATASSTTASAGASSGRSPTTRRPVRAATSWRTSSDCSVPAARSANAASSTTAKRA